MSGTSVAARILLAAATSLVVGYLIATLLVSSRSGTSFDIFPNVDEAELIEDAAPFLAN